MSKRKLILGDAIFDVANDIERSIRWESCLRIFSVQQTVFTRMIEKRRKKDTKSGSCQSMEDFMTSIQNIESFCIY